MTDIAAFKAQLVAAEPALRQWGEVVVSEIASLAATCRVVPQIVSSRVKDVDSAVGKLTRKSYADPFRHMTDLVGARVVCLLSPDVAKLAEAVNNHPGWNALVARNTSDEAAEKPEQFGYQSLHFELRARPDGCGAGLGIPEGTCCELQIRTLMQHAYAEVVHDNIYKSAWGADSKARRYVSNSAALIEAADHLFCETMNILERESQARGELLEQLTGIYDQWVPHSSGKDQKFNLAVLDEYSQYPTDDVIQGVRDLLGRKKTLPEKIQSRLDVDPFWAQPVSLLAYYLVSMDPDLVRYSWPFAESHQALESVFSDLGDSFTQH